MRNMKTIDEFLMNIYSIDTLKLNKKVYKEVRQEILEKGYYTDRSNLTYTLEEVEYAIKLIDIRIRLIKSLEK